MANPQQFEEPAPTISALTVADLDAVDELMKRHVSTLGFLPHAVPLKTIFKRKVCWEPRIRTVDSLVTSCMQLIVTDSALRNSAYRRSAGARALQGSS